MNPQALQLHDIQLPENPSIWPLAVGWWMLIALILLALVFAFIKLRRYFKLKKHKQMLRKEYAVLEKKLTQAPSKRLIAETNVLLRRFALAYYPNSNTASLTGGAWLGFLDASGKTQGFSRGAGRVLIDAPYRSGDLENYNSDEFIPLIRKWVNRTIRTQVNIQSIKAHTHKMDKKVGGCL